MEDIDVELPFWFGPGKGGATLAEIEAAEEHMGQRLPGALRELLMLQDGGVSNYAGYEDGERYFPLLPILGVGASARSGRITGAFDARELNEVPDGIIMFAAQAHSWWGLDYRQGGEPVVVYRDSDEDEIEVVDHSFEGLMKRLV